MGGFIEDTIEPIFNKFISRFKMFAFMNQQTMEAVIERKTAAEHVWLMFGLGMTVNELGFMNKWFYLCHILLIAMIAIAEWPPNGRKIDVVTRGFGLFLSIVVQTVILGAVLLIRILFN